MTSRRRKRARVYLASTVWIAASAAEVIGQEGCTTTPCGNYAACTALALDAQKKACICAIREDFLACKQTCSVLANTTESDFYAYCGITATPSAATATTAAGAATATATSGSSVPSILGLPPVTSGAILGGVAGVIGTLVLFVAAYLVARRYRPHWFDGAGDYLSVSRALSSRRARKLRQRDSTPTPSVVSDAKSAVGQAPPVRPPPPAKVAASPPETAPVSVSLPFPDVYGPPAQPRQTAKALPATAGKHGGQTAGGGMPPPAARPSPAALAPEPGATVVDNPEDALVDAQVPLARPGPGPDTLLRQYARISSSNSSASESGSPILQGVLNSGALGRAPVVHPTPQLGPPSVAVGAAESGVLGRPSTGRTPLAGAAGFSTRRTSSRSDFDPLSRLPAPYPSGRGDDARSYVSAATTSSWVSTEDQPPTYVAGSAKRRDYTAREPDELTVRWADRVQVFRQFDDGWCFGYNATTDKTGVFPTEVLGALIRT